MFSENGFSGSLDCACTAGDTKQAFSVGSGQDPSLHLARTVVENIVILLMKHLDIVMSARESPGGNE